jgi:hypothetical protein
MFEREVHDASLYPLRAYLEPLHRYRMWFHGPFSVLPIATASFCVAVTPLHCAEHGAVRRSAVAGVAFQP